jgi:hypothetical protein
MSQISQWLGSIRTRRRRVLSLDHSYLPQERDWHQSAGVQALLQKAYQSSEHYKDLIGQFAKYRPWFEGIPMTAAADDPTPRWINETFPGFDAVSLYGLLATRNPLFYVEVGSGNSTKFARRAISDHGLKTKIISVDPHPRGNVDGICDQLIRKHCEDVDIDFFGSLPSDTILFVDNTHRSFPNSDVTVFFIEILPILADGMTWGVHDIFFPLDYPHAWRGRFYNEQYLLMCYLMGGGGNDEILLPNGLISTSPELHPVAAEVFRGSYFTNVEKHGGCFWMKRKERTRTHSD